MAGFDVVLMMMMLTCQTTTSRTIIMFLRGFAMDDDTDTARYHFLFTSPHTRESKRLKDMVETMNSVAKLGVELNAEEINLSSVAYKNMLGAERSSWRILSVITSKEEAANGDTQHVALAKELVEKVENGLTTQCLLTLDHYLLLSSKPGEATVCFSKMKGDYYHYLCKDKLVADPEEAKSESLKAYKEATAIAESDLLPTNPIRLGLALNFSVFYYEIVANTERACNMAKQAFVDAAAELDSLDRKSYQDSSLIMRLIMDNLTLWTPDPAEDEEILKLPDDILHYLMERMEISDAVRLGGVSKSFGKWVNKYIASRVREHVLLPSCPFYSVGIRKEHSWTSHEIRRVSNTPIDPETLPYRSYPEFVIVGSMDGAVLIVETRLSPQTLQFVNPVTRREIIIPPIPGQAHPLSYMEENEAVNNFAYGLGWHKKPSEIVVFQLFKVFKEELEPRCVMYSIKTKSWKRFPPLKGNVQIVQCAGTLHKGSNSLYWLARDGGIGKQASVILQLELKELTFSQLSFSTEARGDPTGCLGILHGKLSCLTSESMGANSDPRWEVWCLEEIESRKNWTILYTISDHQLYDAQRSNFPTLLTFTDGGLLFLLNQEKRDYNKKGSVQKQFITVYNLMDQNLQELSSPTSLLDVSHTQAAVYRETTQFPDCFVKAISRGNNVFPTGVSDVSDPAVGGVPNWYLGITPGYLWQSQVQHAPLPMDVANYQMPLLREIEIRLKTKCDKLADAFIDDLGSQNSSARLPERVKLIIEEIERDEAALREDLYSAGRKFAEYYNVLEQILGVLIELVKDLKLQHQHKYDELQKTWLCKRCETMSAKLRVLEHILLLETYTQESVPALHKIRKYLVEATEEASLAYNKAVTRLREYQGVDPHFDTIARQYQDMVKKLENMQWTIQQLEMDLNRLPSA